MSEQLSFRLPIKVARERDAFFVSEANQQAVAQLENTAIWPQGKLILLGPQSLRQNASFRDLGHRAERPKN
jgi:hypothetical protein